MTEIKPTNSPVVAKQLYVSEFLRNEITCGRLAPGSRLPTQVQLVEHFRVSGVTIQRALDRLARDGFIVTRGRNGTFVSTRPPHLYSYGIIFRDFPGEGRSRYHEMLERQVMRLQLPDARRIRIFHGITGDDNSPASHQLLSLVRAQKMAGLILVDGDEFRHTPLMDEKGIHRAALMSRKVEMDCPTIYPDMNGMVNMALDLLMARGHRRIATLNSVPVHMEVGQHLLHAMQARGLEVCAHHHQIVPHDYPEAIRNAVLLLFSPDAGAARPDALFIVDDNLIEAASAGLVAAKVSVPDKVDVVAHCNFPWSTPVLPMTRIGFNTRQLLEKAVEIIDLQCHGRRAPMATRMLAKIETPDTLP